jgi:hypothetical protein
VCEVALDEAGQQHVAHRDRRAGHHGAREQSRERGQRAQREPDEQHDERHQQGPLDPQSPRQPRRDRRQQAEAQHRQGRQHARRRRRQAFTRLDLGEQRGYADDGGPQVRRDQHDRDPEPPARVDPAHPSRLAHRVLGGHRLRHHASRSARALAASR